MTPLSPASRAAEAFAVAVETRASLVDSPRGGEADRYADLLTCVDILREHEVPEPRADFVADLRMRLMDAADTLLIPAETKLAPVVPLVAPANRNQRRLSVAAAAFVVIGGSAGVAAAAENALPGDALYPIKRGIESAQVSLSSSDSGKGQDLLRQASTRLDEVDGLIASNDSPDRIAHTLASFERSAAGGADLLFVAYQRDGDAQDITRLRTMIGSQLAQLDALAGEAPESSLPAFTAARAMLTDLDQQARVLCSDCGPSGIADQITTMAAATSLAGLLSPKETAARAERDAANNRRIAKAAERIAKNTTPQTPAADPAQPPAGPTAPVVGGVTIPSATDPVGDVVKGLTDGLTELLGGDDSLLSETLDTTLDTLTKGLL